MIRHRAVHPLEPLTAAALAQRLRGAAVMEQDPLGPKVMALADGCYLKCFRRKRLITRDLLVPAAGRFTRNAERLARLGVPTLQVVGAYRLPAVPRPPATPHPWAGAATAAVYRPLPGHTLRALLASSAADDDVMVRVGAFIAGLHRQGVYFRSVHPGNLVVDGTRIGLIDVLDLRFRPWSLTRWERRHNWRHFLRCREDWPYLVRERVEAVLTGYCDAADLSRRAADRLAGQVRQLRARLFAQACVDQA